MELDLQEPQDGLTPHIAIGGGMAKEAIDFYKSAFGAVESPLWILAERV